MEWKIIPELDTYEVSPLGYVRSRSTKKVIKNRVLPKGYVYVDLCYMGQKKSKRLHRLVASAFNPNPESKPFVNHKDGNKLNNAADNLEWVTQSENEIHAFTTGLKRVRTRNVFYNAVDKGGEAREYRTINQLAKGEGLKIRVARDIYKNQRDHPITIHRKQIFVCKLSVKRNPHPESQRR